MEQPRILAFQGLAQAAQFSGINLPRPVSNLAAPEASQEMKSGLGDNVDLIEGKFFRILAFLRDYHRPDPFQASDLPVDVEHLRLQERCAIERNNRC